MQREAVFLFDYEGNPDLMEIAVKNARLSGYFDVPSISAILFYNNKKRGIRKRLINRYTTNVPITETILKTLNELLRRFHRCLMHWNTM